MICASRQPSPYSFIDERRYEHTSVPPSRRSNRQPDPRPTSSSEQPCFVARRRETRAEEVDYESDGELEHRFEKQLQATICEAIRSGRAWPTEPFVCTWGHAVCPAGEPPKDPRRPSARALSWEQLAIVCQPTLRQAWLREDPKPPRAFKMSMLNVSCNSH